MNPKLLAVQSCVASVARRSKSFPLIALAILFCCSLAHAAFQTDTWVGGATSPVAGTNLWSITNNWTVGGNPAIGVSTNGDALVFGASATLNPQNDFTTVGITNIGIDSITFSTNGYAVSGNAITLTNGISDSFGSNSISAPLILGANQTFQNTASLASTNAWAATNTVSGTVNLMANTLTVDGSAPFFLTGVISSTNGGAVVIKNSVVARLGAANVFGTNVIQITNVDNATYDTNYTVYTNTYIVDNTSTNYTTFTNTSIATNHNYVWTTNTFAQVVNAVTVNGGGRLQLNNAGALPSGTNVGNLYFSGSGTLDLNGFSPTVNGLQDDGGGNAVIDNKSGTGLYTMTFGGANSNATFTGSIGTFDNNGATAGTIGINKIGWGTEIIGGANNYAGPTTISQGTLKLSSLGSLGYYSTVLTIGSGAVLDVSVLGASGYQPTAAPTISAGTPGKPYTNFLGSYDTAYGTNYVVSITGTNFVRTYQTNTDLANYTNVVATTNYTTVNYSTNTIISVVTNDLVGSILIGGNGGVSPITSVSPGIATWSISGDLTLDNYLSASPNRVFFVLNNTTTPGGGTNSLITVGGTLYVGDELDFVVTPFTGTLAAGTYTLIKAGTYVAHGNTAVDGNSDGANLQLIAERGIGGTFDTTSHAGWIQLTASGTAAPATDVWAGTPANTTWDVHRTSTWKTNGVLDYFYSGDSVVFDDTGVGTVSIFQPLEPASVTFNNNNTNYTFTANASTFITGPGGLTLNGSGMVTLANPNSFTGDVTLNNGTLAIGYYAGDSYDVYNGVTPGNLVMGGGQLYQPQITDFVPHIYFQNLVLNPGASAIYMAQPRVSNEEPDYEISNNVTRAVGATFDCYPVGKSGGYHYGVFFNSTNSPDGTNDYGQNGIMGGWATYNQSDWLYANTANEQTTGGNLAYPFYQNSNVSTAWGAASNVQVSANVSGINSTTINSLKFNNAASVTLTMNSGQTLTVASGGILVPLGGSVPNAITGGFLAGAAGQDLIILENSAAGTLTIGSVITNNGSATGLTTAGSGTIILTGNNVYTGPTYINNGIEGYPAGSLQVGNGSAAGSIASSSAVIDNGVLTFNRSDNTSVSGAISGRGSLTQLGGGVLTLTANNSLSGLVTVSAGTLQLGNGGAAGSVSNAAAIAGNGNLVFDNNNTVSFPKPIGGAGNLTQFGSGTLDIPANETYTGNTIVSNGTMRVLATGSISNTAAIVVNAGAVLDVSAVPGGLTLRSGVPTEVLAGSGTVNGAVTTAAGSKLTPATNGVIGTLTINNSLTLNGGSAAFDVPVAGSPDRINVGGTLAETNGTITIIPGGALANGVYPLIHATNGFAGSAANLIVLGYVNVGQLTVLTNDASANNLSLIVYSGFAPYRYWAGDGAANSWNLGATDWATTSGGGPSVAYADPDYVVFDDTGSTNPAVDLQASVLPTSVIFSNAVKNYVLGANSGSAGKISGGASMVVNGPGQVTLQTVNDYQSGTTISSGAVVQLGNNTAAAEDGTVGTGGVVNNGALIANNFANETISGSISGSGLLAQQGSGALVLAGNNTGFSGPVSVTNILQVGNGVSGTFGTGDVTNNGSLVFNSPASVSVPGVISGSGNVTNLGTGTVTLSGTNSYAGHTVIPAGTVALGSGGALPSTAWLQIDDNATPNPVGALDLHGYDATVAVLTNGPGAGLGTATFEPGRIYNNGTGTNTLTVNGGGSYTFDGQLLDNLNSGSGRLKLVVNNNTALNLAPGYQSASVFSANTFSGGMVVSNAYVYLGPANYRERTDTQRGAQAAGLGTITLEGGHGAVINGNTGFPTNGVLFAPIATEAAVDASSAEYISIPTINVPAGEIGSLYGPTYGQFTFPLTGSGTFTINPAYTRCQLGGDWSAFSGTIILQALTATYGNLGGDCAFYGATTFGAPLATFVMHTNNATLVQISVGSATAAGPLFQMGALAGGDNTSELGGSTHGQGTKIFRATIWAIGGANANATNGSAFVDADCGIRKVGSGVQVLTNNIMSFGGQCVVSNGTLAFAPLGNNPDGFNPLTNNFLVSSNFSLVDPGILDVSQAGGTLYLGNYRLNQTLFGSGTINGNLLTKAGTNTLIAPAWGINSRPPTPGKLKVTGSVTINFPCTLNMYVYRTNGPTGGVTNDSIVANSATSPTIPTINSTLLNVFSSGDTNYAPQSTNVFRFFTGAVPVGPSSGITNITTFNLPAGMFWRTNLDGTLAGYPTIPAGSMAIVNTNAATFVFTAPPGIGSLSFDGPNVVIQGTNGQANGTYYLRSSTNVALAFSNWTTVATNVLSASGPFTFIGTNAYVPGAPQLFYILDNTNQ